MNLRLTRSLPALAAFLVWLPSAAALAQEEPGDDEIPPPPEEESAKPTIAPPSEKRSSRKPADEELAPPPEEGTPAARSRPKAKPAAAAAAPKSKPLSADETVYVVQRKPVVAKWAFEIAPQFMQSVNDRFTLHTGGGLSGLFHFRENFALEATVGGLWGREAAMTREIREKESLKPELVQLTERTWFATGDLQWSPIYGKVSLADLILGQFSAYVSIGGGLMGNRLRNQFKPTVLPWNPEAYDPFYDDPVTRALPPELRFLGMPALTATIGAGIRFYLTEYLGFRMELRDYVQANRINHRFLTNPENTSTVDISNTYMVQLGVSFLTPRLPLGGGKQ